MNNVKTYGSCYLSKIIVSLQRRFWITPCLFLLGLISQWCLLCAEGHPQCLGDLSIIGIENVGTNHIQCCNQGQCYGYDVETVKSKLSLSDSLPKLASKPDSLSNRSKRSVSRSTV